MLAAVLLNHPKIGRPASRVVIRKQNECHKSVTRKQGRIIWERDRLQIRWTVQKTPGTGRAARVLVGLRTLLWRPAGTLDAAARCQGAALGNGCETVSV